LTEGIKTSQKSPEAMGILSRLVAGAYRIKSGLDEE
jgi:hypothetical protein